MSILKGRSLGSSSSDSKSSVANQIHPAHLRANQISSRSPQIMTVI